MLIDPIGTARICESISGAGESPFGGESDILPSVNPPAELACTNKGIKMTSWELSSFGGTGSSSSSDEEDDVEGKPGNCGNPWPTQLGRNTRTGIQMP